MARVKIEAGQEFDVLDADELRTVLAEVASGYLRPPQWTVNPVGVSLNNTGAGTTNAWVVTAGMEFVMTRVEFAVDGHLSDNPFTASSGGIDILVDGQWRDGIPFASGFALSGVYTENESKAIHCYGGNEIAFKVVGGPTSTNIVATICGFLTPRSPAL